MALAIATGGGLAGAGRRAPFAEWLYDDFLGSRVSRPSPAIILEPRCGPAVQIAWPVKADPDGASRKASARSEARLPSTSYVPSSSSASSLPAASSFAFITAHFPPRHRRARSLRGAPPCSMGVTTTSALGASPSRDRARQTSRAPCGGLGVCQVVHEEIPSCGHL